MGFFGKSPWVFHYDGSSCNGCDIEVLACLMPMYDLERFGIVNVGNPKHADILLITGFINRQNQEVVRTVYNQMGDPKVVVAIGICATSGHFFRECYNVLGGVDTTIPVDVYIPGCAARPEAIIDSVIEAIRILEEKRERGKAERRKLRIQEPGVAGRKTHKTLGSPPPAGGVGGGGKGRS